MWDAGPLEDVVFELHGLQPWPREARLKRGDFVVRVDGPAKALAEHSRGLPVGPAGAEALAVRLRRAGASLRWGEPDAPADPGALLAAYRDWGAGSVRALRADSSLLPELAVGGWLEGSVRTRALRRAARPLARLEPLLQGLVAVSETAITLAFWDAVRAEATRTEWRRLTRGYTALLYHRLSGEMKPGQERLDVPPARFEGQMRLLRRLGFRPLSLAELVSWHSPHGAVLTRRRVTLTFDDALADVVEPLLRHAALRPLLFVPTGDVGRRAPWLGDEQVAPWEDLAALVSAGVMLGAHGRTHAELPSLGNLEAEREIAGSAEELRGCAGVAPVAFAYPHGRQGRRERELVRAAGFSLAFTTQPGRNGAGTDPFALRRVSIKAWDSRASLAWKLLTGQQPPRPWERWLILRTEIARRLGRALRAARDHG
jgi:peptidoglycan/xylan/chitin deacetylase (PgdA/CDA1 family)